MYQLGVETTISTARWTAVRQRVSRARRLAGWTGLLVGLIVGLSALVVLVQATDASATHVAVYSLLLAALGAIGTRLAVLSVVLKPAIVDLDSAVSALVSGHPTWKQLGKLATNGSVLVVATFVRARQRDSDVELTTASVHDVPAEFKGGRDLWFRGWFGGDPQ